MSHFEVKYNKYTSHYFSSNFTKGQKNMVKGILKYFVDIQENMVLNKKSFGF